MKVSIWRASLAGRWSVMCKSFASPAIRAVRSSVLKRVMGPIPERPLTILSQAVGISLPTGETMPNPVITTRRFTNDSCLENVQPAQGGLPAFRATTASGLAVFVDVVNRLLNGGDLFCFFVRNFGFEFVFECHHELDHIERIGTEVVKKRGFVLDLGFVHAKLLANYFLDALVDAVHAYLQWEVGKIPRIIATTGSLLWLTVIKKRYCNLHV